MSAVVILCETQHKYCVDPSTNLKIIIIIGIIIGLMCVVCGLTWLLGRRK